MSKESKTELKREVLALAATLQWDSEHAERTFAEIETFLSSLIKWYQGQLRAGRVGKGGKPVGV